VNGVPDRLSEREAYDDRDRSCRGKFRPATSFEAIVRATGERRIQNDELPPAGGAHPASGDATPGASLWKHGPHDEIRAGTAKTLEEIRYISSHGATSPDHRCHS
jgi:hypothetical protein